MLNNFLSKNDKVNQTDLAKLVQDKDNSSVGFLNRSYNRWIYALSCVGLSHLEDQLKTTFDCLAVATRGSRVKLSD